MKLHGSHKHCCRCEYDYGDYDLAPVDAQGRCGICGLQRRAPENDTVQELGETKAELLAMESAHEMMGEELARAKETISRMNKLFQIQERASKVKWLRLVGVLFITAPIMMVLIFTQLLGEKADHCIAWLETKLPFITYKDFPRIAAWIERRDNSRYEPPLF